MSEPKSANPDPSMDDILASIRKIISDDEARAQVSGPPGGSGQGAPSRPAVTALHAVPPATARAAEPDPMQPGSPQPDLAPGAGAQPATGGPDRDDVLLLTDLIEEPRSDKAPPPVPLPRIDPVRASEMPQPALGPDLAGDPSLLTGGAAGSAAHAFARLSQVVQESLLPPAAAEARPAADGGGKTVEDLARELLRPMLREWLDRNLPSLVERMVEREIARLTRR